MTGFELLELLEVRVPFCCWHCPELVPLIGAGSLLQPVNGILGAFLSTLLIHEQLHIVFCFENGFNFGANFTAIEGSTVDGIFTKEGGDTKTLMVGYDGENFGGGVIHSKYDDIWAVGELSLIHISEPTRPY